MNILLIGGTGVLSSAVTAEAMRRSINVTMINRGTRVIPPGVESIISDNREYEKIGRLLAGRRFDAVIDFLCYTTDQLEKSFRLYSKFTEQYFFISSCAVYDTSIGGIYDEDSKKVRKEWPYSVDKWACEELLKKLASQTNCHYTIIRPCLTYGDTRLPYGIAPEFRKHWTLVARVLAGKPIIRWNHGANRWNMMRVEDFAVGMVGLIGNSLAYQEAFNICGDEMPTYDDVLKAIAKKVGRDVITVDVESHFYAAEMPSWLAGEIIGGRSADLTCSNEKIKRIVPEFKQRIGLQEGVSITIDAYRNQNYQLGIDWTFDACTDRIVEKWNRLKRSRGRYRLGFVDYLKFGRISDRIQYYQERYRGTTRIKLLNLLLRVKRRVSRIWN